MNKTIYYIPIEPLEERYSSQWYRNFPKIFKEYFDEVVTIDGQPLSDVVETGAFLDINSTLHYKAEQLKVISKLFYEKKIKDGDVFFVADLEFWGIESIRYLADLQNIKVKIYGFLHAASYTKGDFIEPAAPYGKYAELLWLKICDKVFVGTEYHKSAVVERRILPFADELDVRQLIDKIEVTGNPIYMNEYKAYPDIKKKKQLIISNRFDWEKRPNLSLDFAYLLKKKHPGLNIIITTSRPKFRSNKQWLVDYARNLEKDGILTIYEGLSKDEYHKHLAESSVMLTNTIEENFGYCVIEACIYGTAPLCPNSYSHPELLMKDKKFLYNDEDEVISKIEYLLENPVSYANYTYYIKRYQRALQIMCLNMR